jgi:hypothetical protein
MHLSPRDARALAIVLIALSPIALAALAVSFAWNVEAIADGAPWRLAGLTPRECPGCAVCGMSRAFTALSHGELARALAFNPGVALLYPSFWAVALAGPVLAVRSLLRRMTPCRPHRS